jgi:hypothetical protein
MSMGWVWQAHTVSFDRSDLADSVRFFSPLLNLWKMMAFLTIASMSSATMLVKLISWSIVVGFLFHLNGLIWKRILQHKKTMKQNMALL